MVNEAHRSNILEIKMCKTKTKQKEEEARYDCRYSCLLELSYFDAPRMLCIDPMHSLFLGTGKHMITVWENQGYLPRKEFESIQEFINSMTVPLEIGRIPLKIASGFSGFKADQFKNWITIYSIPALFQILPPEHLECWRHYVLVCRILCKHCMSKSDIELAHHLLLCFFTKVECFYGKEVISPNMHGSAHLQEIYLDYGPSQEF